MPYLNLYFDQDNIYLRAMNEASPSPEYFAKGADQASRQQAFSDFLTEASQRGADVATAQYLESAQGGQSSAEINGDLFGNTTEVQFYGRTIFELNQNQIRSGDTLQDAVSDVAKSMVDSFQEIVSLMDF